MVKTAGSSLHIMPLLCTTATIVSIRDPQLNGYNISFLNTVLWFQTSTCMWIKGDELFSNPKIKIKKIAFQISYEIFPTGADCSHQNGPVEHAHQSVADHVRCLLSCAGLDQKFWPYTFHHHLHINNTLPFAGQNESKILRVTGKKENFKNFRMFGCQVWV